jgi:hypothetical protein
MHFSYKKEVRALGYSNYFLYLCSMKKTSIKHIGMSASFQAHIGTLADFSAHVRTTAQFCAHVGRCLLLAVLVVLLTACSKDDATGGLPTPPETTQRTVVVYMAGENTLSSAVESDLQEMLRGRKNVSSNEQLVVFVDKALSSEKPFIARVTMENRLDTLYRYPADILTSDPAQMEDVLDRALQLCPATRDYGLVLWGHANGWVVEQDSVKRRAYGVDNGKNLMDDQGQWMNIPTLRAVLQELPVRWRFIVADCCNMMTLETAYELRHVTDYLIGSPAEIPALVAPYDKLVPDLFLQTDDFYQNIVDDYATAYPGKIPLSVVRTSELEALAQATRQVLGRVNQSVRSTQLQGCIYYYNDYNKSASVRKHMMYDVRQVVRQALANDEAAYNTWQEALNHAVPYRRIATSWMTNSAIHIDFNDFRVTEDNYSGVSMFFPMEQYQTATKDYNTLIRNLAWYYAVGWADVGW